ncbi:MAG: hypothetical protein HFH14_01350 [Lachnospiraceae bacterium]|nr:hypothetical protein [Lachnospiraceae bacterium]
MYNLSEMLGETEYFNKMFKAKTYADAVEEFYGKYNYIFMEINDRTESAAQSVDVKYMENDNESDEVIRGVKSIIDRNSKKHDDTQGEPDRPLLSDEMKKIVEDTASEFVLAVKAVFDANGKKLPKGRNLMDLNIYMVMYVFPGIIATNREFSYYIAEMIGKKWPETFTGHVLGCADYDSIHSGFRRKFCYITTAVCESLGKEDDCEELNLLRSFRDGYMMCIPGGEQMVQEYYETAPRIVNMINMHSDAGRIYTELYDKYILPCIDMIKHDKLKECMAHYRAMVRNLWQGGDGIADKTI